MEFFAKQLDERPTVVEIARRLAHRSGLAVLASGQHGVLRAEDNRFSYVLAEPVERSCEWYPASRDPHVRSWSGQASAPRWVGVIPYEAGRRIERSEKGDPRAPARMTTPVWQRYAAVVRVDHKTGDVVVEADNQASAASLLRDLKQSAPSVGTFALFRRDDVAAREVHIDRVRRVLQWIERGDVYQVNIARRILFAYRGDPLEAFIRLFASAPAPYSAYIALENQSLCALSPELALQLRDGSLRTGPIKGTRPRGHDAASDAALWNELEHDAKERAELTMAIDLHRNDLGRIAETGSVKVHGNPRIFAGSRVFSRAAEVTARKRRDVSPEDVLRACIPCGSVTGAPKRRAMEIVAELESERRGAYAGAFGYVARDGSITLAMTIRTLELLPDGHAEYFTGGGIVADSIPDREFDETEWKAKQLENLATSA